MMVTYEEIENLISVIDADLSSYEKRFSEEQPMFLEVLQSQAFPLLDQEHRELLLFICTVVYFALSKKEKINTNFDIEAYLEAEEINWGMKEESSDWNQLLDTMFENYEEEDLLAFVEDMTAEDEELPIKDTDREIIFITSKSYIDQLLLQED